MAEAITEIGARWKRMKGHICERKVGQEQRTSRIDLIFEKGQVTQRNTNSGKIGLNHCGIWTMIKLEMEVNEVRRQTIDLEEVDKTLQKDKKPEERDEK